LNEPIILLVLLVLSAFFSGSETALTSLSLARAESLLKQQRPGSLALCELKRNTTRMLVIILIGNNLVNITASALATVIATRWFGHIGPGIAVGVLTLVILVFGEITPKSWAAHNAERLSLIAAPVILIFGRVTLPAVWVLERFTRWLHQAADMKRPPTITELELITMIEHGMREGTIHRDEREMIERVFVFHDLRVRDVMTPRSEVFTLDGNRTLADALPEILSASVSRIPLYEHDPEEIHRVLYLRDVLSAVAVGRLDIPLKAIAHDPLFVPTNESIPELFAELRRQKQHLALVVNEFGMLQGVVTLEDVLEELVGEIYDETDTAPQVVREIAPGTISVAAGVEMRIVRKYFGSDEVGVKPTDTVSYWILDHTHRIPRSGEEFTIEGLRVVVEKADERHIEQVRLFLNEPASDSDAGTARGGPDT
jgi:putative hemolysin